MTAPCKVRLKVAKRGRAGTIYRCRSAGIFSITVTIQDYEGYSYSRLHRHRIMIKIIFSNKSIKLQVRCTYSYLVLSHVLLVHSCRSILCWLGTYDGWGMCRVFTECQQILISLIRKYDERLVLETSINEWDQTMTWWWLQGSIWILVNLVSNCQWLLSVSF